MKLIFESLNDDKIAINEGVFKTASLLVLTGMLLLPPVFNAIEKRNIKKYGPQMKEAVENYIANNKADSYIADSRDMDNLDAVSIITKYKLWTYEDAIKFNKANSTMIGKQYSSLVSSANDWANYDEVSDSDDIVKKYKEIYDAVTDKNTILICNDYRFFSILMLNTKTKDVIYINSEDISLSYYKYPDFISSIFIPMYDYLVENKLIEKLY